MSKKINPLTSVFSSMMDMHESHQSFKKVREVEKTKRNDSDNLRKVHLAEIKAKRDMIMQALNNDYELSRTKIRQSFDVIDKALDTGDLKMLELGLVAMVRVAETSSLVGLSNLVQQVEDKSNVIDI